MFYQKLSICKFMTAYTNLFSILKHIRNGVKTHLNFLRNRMRKKVATSPRMMAMIIGLVPNSHASAFINPDKNAMGCVAIVRKMVAISPYLINFTHFVNTFGDMKRIT